MTAYRTPGVPGETAKEEPMPEKPIHRCTVPERVSGGTLFRKKPCPLPWNWFWRFEYGDQFECECGRKYKWTMIGGGWEES